MQIMALLSGFAGVYTEVTGKLIVLTHNWLQSFCCIELIYVFDIFLHFLYYVVLHCQQVIIKKRPSRNINVQNFWLYVFGIIFNSIAIFTQDFDAVIEKYDEDHFYSS